MSQLQTLKPESVFAYFKDICAIPHGSGDMQAIATYCMDFAQKHGLKAVRDDADNIIIYKPATVGYENADAVILQGHLDMVCQKTEDSTIDFLKDGLEIYADGDFLKAKDTTLGADNGIAVAMILSVLASDDIPHPPLEAVFTTDEETGMIGAMQLDMSLLHGKKMINLDAEEDDTLTVSCAGGSDFVMTVPVSRETVDSTTVTISLKGLKGGHSGVEINAGRVNADILAGRVLNHLHTCCDFDIIGIDGGDKGNAIPNSCCIRLCTADPAALLTAADTYLKAVKEEIADRESQFAFEICEDAMRTHSVLTNDLKEQLIRTLVCAPNGVMDMSASIAGLVETSLNLGILKTEQNTITLHFTLRSNKNAALRFLEEKMLTFSKLLPCEAKIFGQYPSWEFKENSAMQKLFIDCYTAQRGTAPKVEAIHAGLECGVFASGITGLDCIAMGPALYDVHTVNERLSISSTEKTYRLLLEILKKCQ